GVSSRSWASRPSRSRRRAHSTRCAPCAAKRRAHAAPIPELAPVMSTCFPATELIDVPPPFPLPSSPVPLSSPHVPGVPERVPAGLRPHREPVRAALHFDTMRELPRRGGEGVHLVVEPSRQPQTFPAAAYVPTVPAPAPRNPP